MSSKSATAPRANPFEKLTRFGKSPYHLYPATEIAGSDCEDPQLILLCTWSNASPRHIMKYLEGYRLLYPTSPILVAPTSTTDFFNTSQKVFDPAVKFLHKIFPKNEDVETETDRPKIFAHVLSNGGLGQLFFLARNYFQYGTHSTRLPINAILFDSSPTRGSFNTIYGALALGLPRNPIIRIPLSMILALLVMTFFIIPRYLGLSNTADTICNEFVHADSKYIGEKAPRTYVYGTEDVLTPMGEIEVEIAKAKRKGVQVRREVWVGSSHVDHFRRDPERYWGIVREAWEARAY